MLRFSTRDTLRFIEYGSDGWRKCGVSQRSPAASEGRAVLGEAAGGRRRKCLPPILKRGGRFSAIGFGTQQVPTSFPSLEQGTAVLPCLNGPRIASPVGVIITSLRQRP